MDTNIDMMLKKIVDRIVLFVQFTLVLIFILFEELIWEQIAQPVFEYIKSLLLLQKIAVYVEKADRYVILTVFLLLFAVVELAGLAAGIFIVQGKIVTGTILYALKVPIAAFVFWLFHVTEKKLLSFGWFKAAYGWILALFAWAKSREVYRTTIEKVSRIRRFIRRSAEQIKERYFTGENPLAARFRRLYRFVKRSFSEK